MKLRKMQETFKVFRRLSDGHICRLVHTWYYCTGMIQYDLNWLKIYRKYTIETKKIREEEERKKKVRKAQEGENDDSWDIDDFNKYVWRLNTVQGIYSKQEVTTK